MPNPSKKAAVLGYPVSHSRSPRLHGYWLKHYGIDGSYEAIETPPEKLSETLKSLAQQGFAGCNLTLPHKEEGLKLVDQADAASRVIGAVNTIVMKNGALLGSNTDAYGFMENLRQNGGAFSRERALVLGAGGAARAIVYALLEEGFESIAITNRTAGRADALAEHFADNRLETVAWEKREKALQGVSLLVNTTSLGLHGQPPLELSLNGLPREALVTDIVYSPLQTPLLQAALEKGHRTVDGLGMLLYQAVPGFEAWFGKRPQVTLQLREAVLA